MLCSYFYRAYELNGFVNVSYYAYQCGTSMCVARTKASVLLSELIWIIKNMNIEQNKIINLQIDEFKKSK